MLEMINYVNGINESVKLYYEEDNETYVFINYGSKTCEVIDDLKNGLYYTIEYLKDDRIRYFNYIDEMLLKCIIEDIKDTNNTKYLLECSHLLNVINEYMEDNCIEL